MTTADVHARAREAAEDVARHAKRLADRLSSRGVTIDIDIHIDRVIINPIEEIEASIHAIITAAEERIMGRLDQLRAAQGDTKRSIGEVATIIEDINGDLSDLLARLANSDPGSQEVMDATAEATEIKESLAAAVAALRTAAGRYTPGQQPPPPPPPGELTITTPTVDPVMADAGAATAVVTFPLPTAQGGTPPVTVTTSPESGTAFPIGTSTVNVSAVDAAGKTATATFTVTVTANAPGGVVEP